MKTPLRTHGNQQSQRNHCAPRVCSSDSSEQRWAIHLNLPLLQTVLRAESPRKGPSGCKELTHYSFLRKAGFLISRKLTEGTWNGLIMFQIWRQLLGQPCSHGVFASWAPCASCCFRVLALFWISSLDRVAFAYTQVLLFYLLRPPYPELQCLHLPAFMASFHSYFILIIASFSQDSLIQIPKKESNESNSSFHCPIF